MPPKTPNRAQQTLGKRKMNSNGTPSDPKRRKFDEARAVSSQTVEQAFMDGQVDVNRFVKAREYEIKALEDGLMAMKKVSSTRVFQHVPRSMRRRTASHNVSRVPKRLRAKARVHIIEDKTPVKKSKRISSHRRMRLETAKMLQNAKRRAQKERPEHDLLATELREGSTSSKAKYVREAKSLGTPIKVRQPRIKNNRLKEPPIPIAKFRKRQLNKTWLPTHLYHSKRARMTPGKEPLWRFTIPLAPTEKCYRQTHRASTIRGTIAWDTSYISTIGLSGEEKSLIKLLKALGLGTVETDKTIWSQSGERWRRGTRAWHGMLFKRQSYPLQAFCPATVIWNPVGDDCGDNGNETAVVKQTKRKVMIRAHPSTFLQLWEEVLHLSKVQRPSVSVEDLRYDIGSIEIMGPSSTEALVEILRPLLENKEAQPSITNTGEIWNSLRFLQNPSMLPRDAVIAFEVSDPRLNLRSRIDQSSNQNHDELLEICTKWPFGISPRPISLFDRDRRQKATQLLKSQKSINRRKSALNRGEDPQALKDDLRIPVLLFTRQHSDGAQGIWSILLPWKIVSTVWYAIIHCPLSVGGTPRFGGLIQSRQTMYESGCPWFPADFPGTEAGMQWELQERAKAKAEWERKPKGRRKEFTSLDLGMGRKGEIGIGWGCDWQRLLSGQTASIQCDKHSFTQLPSDTARQAIANPLGVITPDGALVCVKVGMVSKGIPNTRARIYRLPADNSKLKAQWLSISRLDGNKPKSGTPGDSRYPMVPGEEDLIGFITTGNYNLMEGKGFGIGSVLLSRIIDQTLGSKGSAGPTRKFSALHRNICIVRDAGEAFGRLARWELI